VVNEKDDYVSKREKDCGMESPFVLFPPHKYRTTCIECTQSNLHHANKGSRPAWVELEVSGDGALSVGNEINVRFALIQLALELY
jgi:hypothetical protein